MNYISIILGEKDGEYMLELKFPKLTELLQRENIDMVILLLAVK